MAPRCDTFVTKIIWHGLIQGADILLSSALSNSGLGAIIRTFHAWELNDPCYVSTCRRLFFAIQLNECQVSNYLAYSEHFDHGVRQRIIVQTLPPDFITDRLYLLTDATVTVLEYLTDCRPPRLASKAHDDSFIEATEASLNKVYLGYLGT